MIVGEESVLSEDYRSLLKLETASVGFTVKLSEDHPILQLYVT